MKVGAAVEITALFPGLISTGVSGRPRSGTVAVTAAEPDWGFITPSAVEGLTITVIIIITVIMIILFIPA